MDIVDFVDQYLHHHHQRHLILDMNTGNWECLHHRHRHQMIHIGEPVQGCAAAALLSAISDALGGHYFKRSPVMPDMILNAVAGREQSHKPLQVNTY